MNARIVMGPGELVQRGTIVIVDGLIADIGTRVTVPPEAWVIDGEGMSVYPGLVDALGDLGLGAATALTEAGSSPGQPPPRPAVTVTAPRYSRGPEDRPGTTSWRRAVAELRPDDERLENWREAGFTSAVTAPRDGILPGQAAFINLAGDRPAAMVVEDTVALPIQLEPQPMTAGYPTSLMGVFAYVRQVFSDARHYERAWSVYRANPRGTRRPVWDRSLGPLARAQSEKWPILIPGKSTKEIRRALELGEAIDANTVVYGGHEAYAMPGILAERNVPVLVSLDWPKRSEDADPDAEEPLRVLRLRERAPSTPAALERAGVRFAFYSDGLEKPSEIAPAIRRAIDSGLSEEAAVGALTWWPAQIYGVADRLGRLESGRIANLIVTDGELFRERTTVRMVFIDGEKYEVGDGEVSTEGPAVRRR